MSDDRRSSVVVIALLGNPFSPFYARARAEGAADARDHCAMNVAVDAPGMARWALTERPRSAVERSRDRIRIGSSIMERRAGAIVVDVDERAAPFGRPVRGRIVLWPELAFDHTIDLDDRGAHRWTPRMPRARVSVELDEPRLSFRGTGYLDENHGDEPLESAFARWSWSRVATADEAAIAYDVVLRGGVERRHGLRFGAGGPSALDAPRVVSMGRTRFSLARTARIERGARAKIVRTLEDGPFYARSVLETSLGGVAACGVHETVDLDRFRAPWVRFLLPFRMRTERT